MKYFLKEQIKRNAGFVWKTLCNNSLWSLNELRSKTSLSEDDLMLAIGWLAKENKIGLHDINGDTQVSLEVNVYI